MRSGLEMLLPPRNLEYHHFYNRDFFLQGRDVCEIKRSLLPAYYHTCMCVRSYHQRNLGMSMRVERSTLDHVKKRFEVNKKMEEKQKDYDFEERMKELREEEEKEKKRRAEEDLTFEEDDEMAAVMGFSGFGSTKKSY
ncbi:hypothetical protein FD755_008453 [Muntiacus reevesi]|uniref:Uncharacterized protein n=1 Tax=Muntiacus reevesi TaxID=9886 RepID=A0A5J5MKM7_MUNRE|nr:hypothetical protein FD755_008453 [Muntiacus reevesi]